jgi:hypothetical protein
MEQQRQHLIASEQSARLVLESRDVPPEEAPSLNVTSRHFVASVKTQPSIVQEAISERMLRLLGTIARVAVAHKPGLHRVIVVSRQRELSPQVVVGLVERLGLSEHRNAYKDALRALAVDLYNWAKADPMPSDAFKVLVDSKTDEVVVQPPSKVEFNPFPTRRG